MLQGNFGHILILNWAGRAVRSPVMGMAGRMLNGVVDTGSKCQSRLTFLFHKWMLHPGQKEFSTGILHHHKLISVIREKITWSFIHHHLEPYELFWQPSDAAKPVQVHGKLYTSEAFLEAHCELQDSPREPGCNLPQVVLGLIFASDSTQLTAFSNAQLWPVYLVIGNQSKDRRSKPSCHPFEHIAYLEKLHKASWVVCYMNPQFHWMIASRYFQSLHCR